MLWVVVVMVIKNSNQKEHGQQPSHYRQPNGASIVDDAVGMRQQLNQGHGQHESRNETHDQLHANVRPSPQTGQPAPNERKYRQDSTVGKQQ